MGIIVFGVIALMAMEQESMPEVESPMMIINTNYPGVSPENVERLVTTRIEGAVGSLSGVKSVSSASLTGSSQVIVEYQYGTNMDRAYMDLRERLDRVVRILPDGVGTPIIMQISLTGMASMRLSVRAPAVADLAYYIDNEIVPEFDKLPTVAEVSVSGGQRDYISVEIIEERMRQYNLTMAAVAGAISSANFTQPAGSVRFGDQNLSMTGSASYRSVQELQNLPVAIAGGGSIRLADVANVFETRRNATSFSRSNGEEVISLNITKTQSATAVALSRQVQEVVAELSAAHPGIEIQIMSDDAEMIQDSIRSVSQTIILAVLISMVVLYLFMGDIRASLVVGSSMPVSLLMAFICMSLMGLSLNIVTMSAMVLGVGLMTDNSIVVLDSCFKNRKGKTFAQSAVAGTKFVILSISAVTFTTVAVFLPLAFTQGMVGQLFQPLGYTIVFSLLASLFAAMTLVPLFFAQYQPEEKIYAPAARILRKLERAYSKLAASMLRKRKTVLVIFLVIAAYSVYLMVNLNMELMPETDEGRVQISIAVRPGLSIGRADEIVSQIEAIVAAHPDVERYTANAGNNNSVTAFLSDDRQMSTAEVIEQWRFETRYIPDCDITIASTSFMTGGMGGAGVQIGLKGNDLEALRSFSGEVADVFRRLQARLRAATRRSKSL
jgi:multidrug efflux pump subunit AcrB